MCAWSFALEAHTPSESFSVWTWDGAILDARITVSEREVVRVAGPASANAPGRWLLAHIAATVEPDPAVCAPAGGASRRQARPGWAQVEKRWRCSKLPDTIQIDAFFDLAAEHTHFMTLEADSLQRQQVLTAEQRTVAVSSEAEDVSRSLGEFFWSGAGHVASGLDHLLFLLALLVSIRRWRDLVIAISGFTVGHAAALLGLSLGWVVVRLPPVESLIGLTVCLAAVVALGDDVRYRRWVNGLAVVVFAAVLSLALVYESVFGWVALLGIGLASYCYLQLPADSRAVGGWIGVLTVFFGLIHGAGYAAGFSTAGLAVEQIFAAVLAFNIGVEVAQLLFVAVCIGVGGVIGESGRQRALAPLMVATAAIGVYWFVARSVAL